jgi:hypothetical protein
MSPVNMRKFASLFTIALRRDIGSVPRRKTGLPDRSQVPRQPTGGVGNFPDADFMGPSLAPLVREGCRDRYPAPPLAAAQASNGSATPGARRRRQTSADPSRLVPNHADARYGSIQEPRTNC